MVRSVWLLGVVELVVQVSLVRGCTSFLLRLSDSASRLHYWHRLFYPASCYYHSSSFYLVVLSVEGIAKKVIQIFPRSILTMKTYPTSLRLQHPNLCSPPAPPSPQRHTTAILPAPHLPPHHITVNPPSAKTSAE